MKVTAIRDPFFGEQLLAVDPPLEPRVEADWRRRLSLYPGRSLSAEALSAAQRNIGGRLPLLGRTLSPGVIEGLEPALEVDSGEAFVHLAPGVGLTAAGEDVVVAGPLRVPVDSLRVYVPEYLLDGEPPPATTGSLDDLFPRRLGPSLRVLREGVELPGAFVAVLQPITGESLADFDAGDPCERDPRDEAYEDRRLIDGARLVLYAWPSEWLPLLGYFSRNQLAYKVFEAERLLQPGQRMPWEMVGLPVGLLAFPGPVPVPVFIDRYAVVRDGGRLQRPEPALPGTGNPFLWQARSQQFAEQLTELLAAGSTIPQAAGHFIDLPPVGVLPPEAVDFDEDNYQQLFFGPRFLVEAAPVPLEQLAPIVQACASLEPLSIFGWTEEPVRILVPVPQVWYEPRLLIKEDVDPLFKQTVDELAAERNEWRGRRGNVREKYQALVVAITGEELTYPDPDAQDGEVPAPEPFDPPEEDYGTTRFYRDLQFYITYVPGITDVLSAQLRNLPLPQVDFERLFPASGGSSMGLEPFIAYLETKVKTADDHLDLGYTQVQTNIFQARQFMLGSTSASRTAISEPLGPIAAGESAAAGRQDLDQLIEAFGQPIPPGYFATRQAPEGDDPRIGDPGEPGTGEGGTLPGGPAREQPIADRLTQPVSVAIQSTAVFGKYQAVTAFTRNPDLLEMVADLVLPGFDVPVDPGSPFPPEPTFGDLVGQEHRILEGEFDPTDNFFNEGDYFSGGVHTAEDTVGILHIVAKRLAMYKQAIALCRQVLADVDPHRAGAGQRLEVIDARLAEARHDVAVGLSLFAEEEQRIEDLNNRRRQILEQEVPFLLFHRPRLADHLTDMPVRRLYPAPSADPVPLCLGREVEAPPQLAQMLELLRAAPIVWFPGLRSLLAELKRLEELWGGFQDAQHAASALAASFFEPSIGPSTGGQAEVADGGSIGSAPNVAFMARLATAGDPGASVAADGAFAGLEEGLSPMQVVDQAIGAQTQVLADQRFGVANLDLGSFQDYNWSLLQQEAPKILSFGDLMNVGRRSVARKAVAAYEDLGRVAACLYAGFSTVRPSRRLSWVQLLSQYDAPFDLRWLATLPGWQQVGFLERRELQTLVDWLFQRVDPEQADAVAWMNDLVRVCILLASSAPVDRLVAGSVIATTSVQVGGTVQVAFLDVGDVHVGATALFYGFDDQDDEATGRGVVIDLAPGVAVVRLDQAVADTLRLEAGARVEVTGTSIFSGSPPIAGPGPGGQDPTL